MKRKYEIVYIFDSALEEPEVNEHLERFHGLLKTPEQPEPITGIAHWGKRTLAYPIKNKEVGYYVVAHFETDTTLLGEFERILKLSEAVIRYLVVINEGLSVERLDQSGAESATAEAEKPADKSKKEAEAAPAASEPSETTEAAPEAPADDQTDSTDEEGE